LYDRYDGVDVYGNPLPNVLQDRFQSGFAYRPVDDNRWDALIRYEYRRDHDPTNGIDDFAHIMALVADYHPSRPWYYTGRLAMEYKPYLIPETNATVNYAAALISGRVAYDITEKIDLGLMSSAMIDNLHQLQYAQGLEIGYQLYSNLWASAGYNWMGFHAPDISGTDYSDRGFYIRMRYKFDEKLMGGGKPEVNHLLAPAGN
jgi:hypothetical protein